MKTIGYGVQNAKDKFEPLSFDRKEPGDSELGIKVTHCGVCHSDLHQARNDWDNTTYPCVPGHEIVGEVTKVGGKVSKFKVGDRVAVGCMINSCLSCDKCEDDLEQFCQDQNGCTLTYNGYKNTEEANSYGGYSDNMVVREEFALSIPDALKSESVGPIVCAGITVYSPMKNWNLKEGQTLGVAGIGGLGHMAIKIGKAMGAKVVAFTRNSDKKEEILKMGADSVVISDSEDEMEKAAASLDMLINTIPVQHDINPYVALMKSDSTLVIVGNMMGFEGVETGPLVFNRVTLAGSLIGGIKETQEVIDLCAKYEISPKIKLIDIKDIDSVFDKLADGDTGQYRHVIDMDSLRKLDSEKAAEVAAPSRGDYA